MNVPSSRLDRTAMILMVVLCSVWGLQQAAIKVASIGVSPVLQAGLRSLGACVLVWGWARWRGVALWRADGTLWPGMLAGALFAGEFALLYLGLAGTTAARGVIFLYTAPFIVSLGAVLWVPGESMSVRQWVGLALAFGGVLALFGQGLGGQGGGHWLGDALILLAALLWAATTLTVKLTRLATAPPEKTLLYQLAVSALVLLPLSPLLGEPGILGMRPVVWASLAFQIVVVAAASYLGWFWLVRHYPATRLAAFSFLTPVMGVLAGVGLLDEPAGPMLVGALCMVGAGIWLANRRG